MESLTRPGQEAMKSLDVKDIRGYNPRLPNKLPIRISLDTLPVILYEQVWPVRPSNP